MSGCDIWKRYNLVLDPTMKSRRQKEWEMKRTWIFADISQSLNQITLKTTLSGFDNIWDKKCLYNLRQLESELLFLWLKHHNLYKWVFKYTAHQNFVWIHLWQWSNLQNAKVSIGEQQIVSSSYSLVWHFLLHSWVKLSFIRGINTCPGNKLSSPIA